MRIRKEIQTDKPIEVYKRWFIIEVRKRAIDIVEEESKKDKINQSEAFRRFGRSNVERWVRQRKIEIFNRPKSVEYKLQELIKESENPQDYF